jgi:hypothetical protein
MSGDQRELYVPGDDGTPSDYRVGYGKPPVATRFRKGRSGNPKGRPKASKTARSLLDQALSAPITITEAGRTKVVEQRAALFKSLLAKAIRGDARAAALVVRLMEQFDLTAPRQDQGPLHIIRTIVRPSEPGAAANVGLKVRDQ